MGLRALNPSQTWTNKGSKQRTDLFYTGARRHALPWGFRYSDDAGRNNGLPRGPGASAKVRSNMDRTAPISMEGKRYGTHMVIELSPNLRG